MENNSKADGFDVNGTHLQGAAPQDRISSALKKVYDDVANEPLPENLSSLLEQLRQSGQNDEP